MDFFSWFGIGNIINFFVAAGTIAMAVVGFISINKTKESIQASLRSAEANEKTVERMKDSLMPYFVITFQISRELIISIHNVGGGLGKIRAITVREDIEFNSVYNPTRYWAGEYSSSGPGSGEIRICDYVLGAKEHCAFVLGKGTTFNPDQQYEWLSSLSIYYEDIYSRNYCSRILYVWDRTGNVKVVATEHFDNALPPIDFSVSFNVSHYYSIEGPRPFGYLPQYLKLHLRKLELSLTDYQIPGTPFTGHNSIQIKKITFTWNGIPKFVVRIKDNREFIISWTSDTQMTGAIISDVLEETIPYEAYGLFPDGNDEGKKYELYKQIVDNLLNIPQESSV